MIVRDGENAYAFIHNPRTSGTSITEYLINNCGGRRLHNVPEYVQEHSIYAEETRYRKFPNHYFFGFVRNPWSREWTLHKLYMRDTGNVVDFKKWLIEDFPWYRRPQYGMFCDLDGNLKVNIHRFENRTEAIEEIASRIGTNAQAFESYNVNNGFNTGMKYVQDYDNEMIDCVAERYYTDIDAFGYYFDGHNNLIKSVPFEFIENTMNYNIVEPKYRYINA
jgi:hypothetical protein